MEECPVCLSEVKRSIIKYRFNCSHFTCVRCLNLMNKDGFCKCPICRSLIVERNRRNKMKIDIEFIRNFSKRFSQNWEVDVVVDCEAEEEEEFPKLCVDYGYCY